MAEARLLRRPTCRRGPLFCSPATRRLLSARRSCRSCLLGSCRCCRGRLLGCSLRRCRRWPLFRPGPSWPRRLCCRLLLLLPYCCRRWGRRWRLFLRRWLRRWRLSRAPLALSACRRQVLVKGEILGGVIAHVSPEVLAVAVGQRRLQGPRRAHAGSCYQPPPLEASGVVGHGTGREKSCQCQHTTPARPSRPASTAQLTRRLPHAAHPPPASPSPARAA